MLLIIQKCKYDKRICFFIPKQKNSLPDFNTNYQMPSQNRTNVGSNNNYIKLDTKEDFKYSKKKEVMANQKLKK